LKSPQSLNRYAYVQNDPVNFTDETGKFLSPCEKRWWEIVSTGFMPPPGLCSWGDYMADVARAAGSAGAGIGNDEEQRRRPRTPRVDIVQSGGITLGACGYAEFNVVFLTENIVKGLLAQHVTITGWKTDKNGNPLRFTNNDVGADFIEGWEYDFGWVQGPGDTFRPNHEGVGSKGQITIDGYFKYFDGQTKDYLGLVPNSVSTAGPLPATDTRNSVPALWGGDIGGQRHRLTVSWDCTDGKQNKTTVVQHIP
jgi:hypothetical protein